MKKILFEEKISYRNQPRNLETKDNFLFEHEYTRKIKSSYIFFEKNVYSFNSIILSLRKLKYFRNYSFFGDKTAFERIKRIIKNYIYSSKDIIEIEKGIWFTDNKSHVYFHWLFDALERAEIVYDYQKEYPLLVPEEFYKQPFISESLNHLNYKYIVLDKNKIYKIKNLLVTSKTALTGNYNEAILEKLIKRFKSNIDTNEIKTKENIFIYREPSIGRSIYNFNELKTILEKYNFDIVAFEEYSFSEKITMLRNCRNLLGLFGSGLSNMIFLQKGSNLIEIRKEKDSKNNAFYSLASACNLNYYYDFFKLDSNGCVVDVESLDKLLESLE